MAEFEQLLLYIVLIQCFYWMQELLKQSIVMDLSTFDKGKTTRICIHASTNLPMTTLGYEWFEFFVLLSDTVNKFFFACM